MKKKFLVAICIVCLLQGLCFADSNVTVLNKVNSPQDVRQLSLDELEHLAADIRYGIIHRVDTVGGHVGPALGFVEPTIALHYVFDTPNDKLVFDTSHQTYPHKMLTGRKRAYLDPLHNLDISPYTDQAESEYDLFRLGHTSTSISLAVGVAKARDIKNEKYNVVAIIGDGSLSGGEALEGLSTAAVLGTNIIIVVNDNEMAISENHGGIYTNLRELRKTNGKAKDNMFKAMGFDYYYLEEGNDTQKLINLFKKVKDTTKPTVVHLHTLKGKGFAPAVADKETYHKQKAHFLQPQAQGKVETYATITTDYLLNKTQTNKNILVISPATPSLTGLNLDIREKLGTQYLDAGIAEQNAVGIASGCAANGGKPVVEVLSSFIQRTYDQLSQDMAINNAPVVLLIFDAGITNLDITHYAIFDIPLISNIPNIVYLSPTTKEEYIGMLDFAVANKSYPVAIRLPQNLITTNKPDTTNYAETNKYKVTDYGDTVAIIGAGNFYPLAQEVKQELKSKAGINATVINPVFLTGIDKELLENLKKNHKLVITLEDGCLDGGYSEKITRFYANSNMKVINYGALKEFSDRTPVEELYKKYRLTKEQIVEDIEATLRKSTNTSKPR